MRSHDKARAARARGVFAEEIVPLNGAVEDDHIQKETVPEYFAKSKATYGGGLVTGANAHGLVDGGAAVLLGSDKAAGRGGAPLGRFVAWSVAGVAPGKMAFASVPAIQSVLKKAGWKLEDVDLFEVNETFAAQLLVVKKELNLPEEKLNVNGGAVALGHPFGATGARLVITLLNELKRRKAKKGVAAICVGGGQGVAAAVETQ
jgi:acetyl-CoA acetyltransferase family protein